MRESIRAIVTFVETSQVPALLVEAERERGALTLCVVCLNILHWLRSDLFIPRRKGKVSQWTTMVSET